MGRFLVYVLSHKVLGEGVLVVRCDGGRSEVAVLTDRVVVGHALKEGLREQGYELTLIYDSHGEEGD